MDLDFATASELTLALRDRTISSRELLDHILSRVDQLNPGLNAIVAFDVDRARAAAAAADVATAKGDATGLLHGLPMTVKDVWETEGLVTTAGAPELKNYVPESDALAVGRLKAAGAIIFGKTNTPLYAGDFQTFNDVYGRTNNPWDTSRTVGGSSGGAAAAVVAGLVPLELGSDIGGSIRNPAHFNGVYGLKPSWGVVPSRGHIPGPPGTLVESDVNCNGPLARSLDDLGLGLGVVAGPVPEDAAGWRLELEEGPAIDDVRTLRIATVFHEGSDLLPVAGGVLANLDAFARRLADAGARVDTVALPVALADGLRSWQELVLPIIGTSLPDEAFAAFAELETVAGDDPMITAGRALTSRYRVGPRQRATPVSACSLGPVVRSLRRGPGTGDAVGGVPSRHRSAHHGPRARHRRHGRSPPDRHGVVRRHRLGSPPRGDAADGADGHRLTRGCASHRSLPLRYAPASDGGRPRCRRRSRIFAAADLSVGGPSDSVMNKGLMAGGVDGPERSVAPVAVAQIVTNPS